MHKTVGNCQVVVPGRKSVLIYITQELYDQVNYLVNHEKFKSTEVQWYHRITKYETNETIYYMLDDLVIPHQTISYSEVDTNAEQQYKTYTEIKQRFTSEEGIDKEEMNKFISSMTCWCHSHHGMGVRPSAQDDKQYLKFIEDKKDDGSNQPFMMMIWNRKGELYTQLNDPALGYGFENVPMYIHRPTEIDSSYIDEAIENKMQRAFTRHRHSGNYLIPMGKVHGVTKSVTKNTKAGGSSSTSDTCPVDYADLFVDGEHNTLRALTYKLNNIPADDASGESEKLALQITRIIANGLTYDPETIRATRLFLQGGNKAEKILNGYLSWSGGVRKLKLDDEIQAFCDQLLHGIWPDPDTIWMSACAASELDACGSHSQVRAIVSSHMDLIEKMEQNAWVKYNDQNSGDTRHL